VFFVVNDSLQNSNGFESTFLSDRPDEPSAYCKFDETDRRFDSNRARTHLTSDLGMSLKTAKQSPEICPAFNTWLSKPTSTILAAIAGYHRLAIAFLVLVMQGRSRSEPTKTSDTLFTDAYFVGCRNKVK